MNRRTLAFALMVVTALSLTLPQMAAAAMPTATVPGDWSPIGPLPPAASVLTMTGGADNRLYAFGFCEGASCPQTGGAVSSGSPVTYVYDPADATWHKGRPAPQSCSGALASALAWDGTIHLAGCWDDIVTDAGFREAIYHPQTNSWTMNPKRGPYVDPIVGMAAANGRIYWFSETLRNDGSAVFISGHRMLVGKPDGSWRLRAREPKNGPSDGAALGSDGRVYVAGGSRECHPEFGTCPVPPVEAWKRSNNNWSKPTDLPTPRIRVGVASDARGRVFAIGGLAGDGSALFSNVDVYRPNSGTWATAAKLPDTRFAVNTASTPDGHVWAFGGYDSFGNPLNNGYVFTPGS